MPLRTQVREQLIQSAMLVCRKTLALRSKILLTKTLAEIDHQVAVLSQRRERVVKMIQDHPDVL